MADLEKNQEYEAEIVGYTSEGLGVCRISGRAVFVPFTIEGEKWRIRIVKVSSTAVFGKAMECFQASACRQSSDCPYFGKCGGCNLRHMSYAEELRLKKQRVEDAFSHIAKEKITVEQILAAESENRYRNKCIFNVTQSDHGAVFGFYRERSHDLIETKTCFLQNEVSTQIAQAVVNFLNDYKLSAYDELTGKGTVRNIFIRSSHTSSDVLVCIVSASGFGEKTKKLIQTLKDSCPKISGIVLNINKTKGNSILSGDFYTLYGKDYIQDTLLGNEFKISTQSFFQINPPQAEKLYQCAIDYAQHGENNLAVELYCGAGTISLCLAPKFKQVISAEIVPEAVENAKENAKQNNIDNVSFICADAADVAKKLADEHLMPDVVLVDPPRKGLETSVIDSIAKMQPQRIVYVSCNPATLARDVALFRDKGYRFEHVSAVDMFPRTAHVESVVQLKQVGDEA